jgi:hypothetical protein
LKPFRKRLRQLQNLLGAFNDSVVARENLRGWIATRAGALPAPTVSFLGKLEERLRVQGESCLEEFPERFREFKKRPWRSLKKALK